MFVMTYSMEERKHEKNMRVFRMIGAAAATAAGAVIGGLSTDTSSAWYTGLTLSPLQPPPWAFAAIWTVLYILLAVSFVRIVSKRRICRAAAAGYIINIILNALWSPVFFLSHAPLPALIVMAALLVNLFFLMRNVFSEDRPAFVLLLPYLIWLCIAAVLNVSILALN